MTRLFLALVLVLSWSATPHAQTTDHPLVLVANAHSAIVQLKTDEARKLYLGMPMMVDGALVHPLLNNSNEVIQEMFMQKVMFMSTPAYERQVVARMFRTGGSRPSTYTDLHELIRELEADRNAVTYLSRDVASLTPGIRIIGEP